MIDLGQRSFLSYLSTFSKGFSSEVTEPISVKFHNYAASRQRGGKIHIFGLGHMTKVASMPIYGKFLQKSSSSEAMGPLPVNLVCNIWGSFS